MCGVVLKLLSMKVTIVNQSVRMESFVCISSSICINIVVYVSFHHPLTICSICQCLTKWQHVSETKFMRCYNGTNNCWFPLARKWPTWKWTWIWIPYGKIEKKCPRYFRWDSRGNPRDLNMCRTGRSAALSRRRKSMPLIEVLMKRESMKLVVQQRKCTYRHSNMNESTLCLYSNFSMIDIFIYRKFV